MRLLLITALIAVSTSAFAANPPELHEGQMLRDANNVRLGPVEDVAADGTVGVIIDSKYEQVPATTLKVVDGKAFTTMTEAQIVSQ